MHLENKICAQIARGASAVLKKKKSLKRKFQLKEALHIGRSVFSANQACARIKRLLVLQNEHPTELTSSVGIPTGHHFRAALLIEKISIHCVSHELNLYWHHDELCNHKWEKRGHSQLKISQDYTHRIIIILRWITRTFHEIRWQICRSLFKMTLDHLYWKPIVLR